MAFWKPKSSKDEPKVQLSNWSVHSIKFAELPEPVIILVGYNETEKAGRVSSQVVKEQGKYLITANKRKYELLTDENLISPSKESTAQYVFTEWKRLMGVDGFLITGIKDISDKYKTNRKTERKQRA